MVCFSQTVEVSEKCVIVLRALKRGCASIQTQIRIGRLRALLLGPYRILIPEVELAALLQPITITLQPPEVFWNGTSHRIVQVQQFITPQFLICDEPP
jgi:hypothetical protein